MFQYVTLDNKIKCLSLAVFLWQPTNKTGTAYTWELLIANRLDQSLWSTNQKYWAAFRSNLLHSSLEVHTCVAPNQTRHAARIWSPISWAKPAHFDFFTINFTVWSHIPTGGDALSICIFLSAFTQLGMCHDCLPSRPVRGWVFNSGNNL